MAKIKIKIIEKATGRDVTDERDWYIDIDGTLCYETNDVDMSLQEAGDEYVYQLTIS